VRVAVWANEHGQIDAIARHLLHQVAEHAVRRHDFERASVVFTLWLRWRPCRTRRQQQTQNEKNTDP
jgi:hypothetical protein